MFGGRVDCASFSREKKFCAEDELVKVTASGHPETLPNNRLKASTDAPGITF